MDQHGRSEVVKEASPNPHLIHILSTSNEFNLIYNPMIEIILQMDQ